MAHPFNSVRDHKIQHARVADITKACGGRMAVGGAAHDDEAADKKLVHQMVKKAALRATGGAVQARADRPARARGGGLGMKKAHKKGFGKTTVNVVVAPHHPAVQGVAGGLPPGLPGGPPPGGPPPGAPPPRPPMAGPGGSTPPMPPPRPPGAMGGPPGVSPMPPGVPVPQRFAKDGGRIKRAKGGATRRRAGGGDVEPAEAGDPSGEQPVDHPQQIDPQQLDRDRAFDEQLNKRGPYTNMPYDGTPKKYEGGPYREPPGGKRYQNLKRGGAVIDSNNAGIGKGRTKIQRDYPSNKQDTQNIGRGPVITKARGGKISKESGGSTSPEADEYNRELKLRIRNIGPSGRLPPTSRATGGPIYSKPHGQMGPKFTGGGHSGLGRMQKANRMKPKFGAATRTATNPTRDPKA